MVLTMFDFHGAYIAGKKKKLLGQATDGDENQGTKQSTEAKDARNNTLVFVAEMTIMGLKQNWCLG